MPKNSLAKNYQNNKEMTLKKSLFFEEKEKKSNNMVVNNTRIYQKMENKRLLSIEEIL